MKNKLKPELAERIDRLVAGQREGESLLQPFYRDADLFEHDVSRVHLQHWLCAGHVSQVPEPGDWFRFDVAEESLILVRGSDRRVRALVNVCRHRGSRICWEEAGHDRMLTCPYHAWVYDLEGKLRSARSMSDVDPTDHSLAQVHCRVVEGLVFVCFAATPPEFGRAEEVLASTVGRYGWADARIAGRTRYPVAANWKLVTENYQECYHCRPAHPEFSRSHATEERDEVTAELRKRVSDMAAARGIEIPEVDLWPGGGGSGHEGISCSNDAMYEGSVTGSQDGKPVAPLMGDFDDYCGGFFTYVEVGPASFFLAYPDHGVIYLFVPHGPQETDMEVIWLVDGQAEEGVDYDPEQLTWLWDVTSKADKAIIEHNQQGVNSRYYVPGPYAPVEDMTRNFVTWYLETIHP